jgi:hypothetical protein
MMKLVTPKVGAKHELLFNKPATAQNLSHSNPENFKLPKPQ